MFQRFGLNSVRWITLSMAVLLVHAAASVSLAHDESVPCTIEVVIHADRARVLLKFPIQSMLNADASADPANLVRIKLPEEVSKIDRETYARNKSTQMCDGVRITFDSVSLTGKVLKISTDDLILGVSSEDEMPRPVGVYEMEYTPPNAMPAPKLVTLDYNLLPTPVDGSNISTSCMVVHQQVDRKPPYPVFLTDGDRMTMTCDWSSAAGAVLGAGSSPNAVTAAPNTTKPATKPAKDPTEVGNLYITIGTGIIVAAFVLMVLAFIYLRERD